MRQMTRALVITLLCANFAAGRASVDTPEQAADLVLAAQDGKALGALAAMDAPDDGHLTCLEVFRSSFPADLVGLSACGTARGRVYRAEGVVGLVRAFVTAGAPRVLCSPWKVDDRATKALMVKFHELLRQGDTGAASASRRARHHVASHEPWKHPYYRAAWQLWGLPD